MATASPAYLEIIEFIAAGTTSEGVVAFHPSPEAQNRVIELIEPFERMRNKYRNGANVTVVKEAFALTTRLSIGDVRIPGLPKLDPEDRERLAEMLTTWPACSERAKAVSAR